MRKTDVLKHWNNSAVEVSRVLGISLSAISQWGEYVPEGRAYQIEAVTQGALRVDRAFYENQRKECSTRRRGTQAA